jgi:hypothetical protein
MLQQDYREIYHRILRRLRFVIILRFYTFELLVRLIITLAQRNQS